MKHLIKLFRVTALLMLLTPLHPAFAAETPAATKAAVAVKAETIKAKLEEVKASTDLEEASKTTLTELYQKALTFQEEMASSTSNTTIYKQARESAPAEAQVIREKLEAAQQNPKEVTPGVSDDTPLPEVEQELLKQKADSAAVEAKLNGLEGQLAIEKERPNAIRKRLTEAKQRQEEIIAAVKLPAPADESASLTEAKRWALQSEGMALMAEINALDQELLSQPARIQLLDAQRDQTAASLKRIRTRVQMIDTLLSRRRLADAEQARTAAEAAQREAIGKHPLVQELAQQNAALSQDLISLASRLEQATAEEDTVSQEAKNIGEALRDTRKKVGFAGLNKALGQLLLEQRQELPDPRAFRKKDKVREQEINDAGLRLIQYEEERRSLRNIPDYVRALVASLPEEEAAQIQGELEELVNSRKALLETAMSSNQSYLRTLGELDFTYHNFIEKIETYDKFLGEHLLWVRSVPPPNLELLYAIPEHAAQLLSPTNWYDVLRIITDQATHSPGYMLLILIAAVLLLKRRQSRRALLATAEKIGRPSTDQFTYTFQALLLSLVLAAPWPLLLAATGWELGHTLEHTEFSRTVAKALLWVAPPFYYLGSFRAICIPGGLAEMHFRWDAHSLKLLRRLLIRFMFSFLPILFIAVIVISQDSKLLGGGLGRLLIIFVLVTLALFSFRLFNPRRGALLPYQKRYPKSPLSRLRYLWLILGVATPLGLAGLAIAGYLYTAGALTRNLLDTLWFILVLVIIHQLLVRWLLVTRRRLAFRAIIERRRARAEEKATEKDEPWSGDLPEQVEEPVVDLITLDQESRKLLNMSLVIVGVFGVWLFWSDILPAFAVLEKITLWYSTTQVAGQETPLPITLADIGLALLVAVVTILATKQFPSLLEMVLLQRLKMTAGGRYAAKTLARYAIATGGTILAIGMLGGRWGQIQWLVAALSLGIGFGLQEIVANFISGIIILFEQPIRVGDMVTVGDSVG
ncbi:MAG: mechanosensitive ion channel, partial [Pseudomonadota bacterium]|nr:mechanosensitive ion channel [Pseudomonadota bacterium]